MRKRKTKLTLADEKCLYKTFENFNRIRKGNARIRKAIKLNNELNYFGREKANAI